MDNFLMLGPPSVNMTWETSPGFMTALLMSYDLAFLTICSGGCPLDLLSGALTHVCWDDYAVGELFEALRGRLSLRDEFIDDLNCILRIGRSTCIQ